MFLVETVWFRGWSGMKDGPLLRAAVQAEFQILLTADGGFAHQQNIEGLPLGCVILSTQDWPVLSQCIQQIALVIANTGPGDVRFVNCGTDLRRR